MIWHIPTDWFGDNVSIRYLCGSRLFANHETDMLWERLNGFEIQRGKWCKICIKRAYETHPDAEILDMFKLAKPCFGTDKHP